MQRRATLGFERHHVRAIFERGGQSADQPAAADAHQYRVRIAGLVFDLERKGPRTGDHLRLVIRMDEQCAGTLLAFVDVNSFLELQ